MLFETERLRVRQLTAHDIDAMYAVYGDADAMRWVGDGKALSRKRCAEWIDVTQRNYAVRGYGMSTLTLRSTAEIVGFCGLVHPEHQAQEISSPERRAQARVDSPERRPEARPEIKYALDRHYWGQGFATEAARGMLAWGAGTFALREIIATTAPENIASQKVLLKAGMRFDADRMNDDGTRTRVFVWRTSSGRVERSER